MNFIQHPSNSRVLGAPPGVRIEDCRALPITDTVMNDMPAVASFWMPSEEEKALIAAGKPVFLIVAGRTHAPLYIGVEE